MVTVAEEVLLALWFVDSVCASGRCCCRHRREPAQVPEMQGASYTFLVLEAVVTVLFMLELSESLGGGLNDI